MSTCALIGAVEFNAEHFLRQEFDYVIAVDAGYRHLQQISVEPDLVLGDFDSLGYVPEHPSLEQHPAHKDASDIELALEQSAAQGFDTLVIYGCLSGRLDHTYGVLQLIARYSKVGKKVFGIGDTFVVSALTGGRFSEIRFSEGAIGTFSTFAFDAEVTGVDEVGMEYPLDKASLVNTTPLGVSNELLGAEAKVSVEKGTLLVFFPIDAWEHMLV